MFITNFQDAVDGCSHLSCMSYKTGGSCCNKNETVSTVRLHLVHIFMDVITEKQCTDTRRVVKGKQIPYHWTFIF